MNAGDLKLERVDRWRWRWEDWKGECWVYRPYFLVDLFESCPASAVFFCMGMGIGHDYFIRAGDCFVGENC